ncbi:MAG: membrane protein insertion efficiency factor YidD [Candidatus Gracilibacteria bacterium]
MLTFIKECFISLIHIPQQLALLMIRLYQKTLSPDHGPLKDNFPGGFCRFTPSCSEYSRLAILRYGLIRGGLKSMWRILRCNPCSHGGVDFPTHGAKRSELE